ncbi:MAG: hypothetical protein ACI8PZ_005751, partial [Myxococcota bacterium]
VRLEDCPYSEYGVFDGNAEWMAGVWMAENVCDLYECSLLPYFAYWPVEQYIVVASLCES